MKRLFTSAVLGASLALSACGGGNDDADQTGADAMANGDAMASDTAGTMSAPADTTTAAEVGADTGAADSSMDAGGATTTTDDDTGAAAGAGGAGAGSGDTTGQ